MLMLLAIDVDVDDAASKLALDVKLMMDADIGTAWEIGP